MEQAVEQIKQRFPQAVPFATEAAAGQNFITGAPFREQLRNQFGRVLRICVQKKSPRAAAGAFQSGATGSLLAEIPAQDNDPPARESRQFLHHRFPRSVCAPVVHNHQFPFRSGVPDSYRQPVKQRMQPFAFIEHGNDNRN
jgi:hypothetical protein